MDERTARRLADVNRAFYRDCARSFSDARQQPWPGWHRLLAIVRAQAPADRLEVLDVGCGNGRLAAFLASALPRCRYLGLDESAELLALAAERGVRNAEFLHADVVFDDPRPLLGERRFDLVTLFGVLHHVPGAARRRALVERLLGLLRPTGLLALTIWQLAAFERFRSRILPWERWSEPDRPAIDPGQLEPGDFLLPWGDAPGPVRYCHFVSERETAALLAGLPASVVASYRSDGRGGSLNHYLVLRPTGRRAGGPGAARDPRPGG